MSCKETLPRWLRLSKRGLEVILRVLTLTSSSLLSCYLGNTLVVDDFVFVFFVFERGINLVGFVFVAVGVAVGEGDILEGFVHLFESEDVEGLLRVFLQLLEERDGHDKLKIIV